MRIQTPPQTALSPDLLARSTTALSAEHNGRYLHWDELRRRPVFDDLSHEDWWSLVKVARRSLLKSIPLTDVLGHRFSFAMSDAVQRLVHELDRDASGRIELPEDIANHATRDRYVVNSLIEEAIRSSQLEGAATTRAVAVDMIRSKRAPRDLGERMILNNFSAMEWVRDHAQRPLTPAMVLELHAIVTRDTLDSNDAIGRLRRPGEDVRVIDHVDDEVLHTPPDAELLPARMEAMCGFANAASSDGPFIHPVVRAILIHFWLAYDHPFVDGNGRTARALFYWSMLKQGYWLTEFISISRAIQHSRAQYDRAFLYSESDDNDATYFVLNQLRMLRQAVDDLSDYLKRKAEEVRSVERRLRDRDDLNHRQLALLGHALRQPATRFTIEGHQMSHRVVYETARTDLLGLVRRGFLEQAKSGKKLVFTAAPDLQRRLGPVR
jgi:Fic family protein